MGPALRPALTGTPVLETRRLWLRAPVTADFETFAVHVATERARYTGGPQDRSEAWRSFCHLTGHWVHRGYGMFFFTEKASDTVLGFAGPHFPEGWPGQELGWSVMVDAAEGKGFALEAVGAARGFAYDVLGWTTAISLIDSANIRSQALARRLGCLPEAPGVVLGKPCVIWRHPAPEAVADDTVEACA